MRLAAAALAAGLVGCADEPGPCDHELCWIADDSCVRRVVSVVACQREVERLTPEIRRLTRAEVFDEWTTEMPTQEEVDYLVAEGLVGLMPPNYTPSQATADRLEGVAAFYSSETKAVTIIEDSGVMDDTALGYEILTHEMVHAYQDAELDLTGLLEAYATSYDRFLGLRAVVEGDATLFQSFAATALLGFSPTHGEWQAFIDEFQMGMLEAGFESETPSADALGLFPYAFGLGYVYPAWDDDGMDGIATVLGDPPDSVRQVMRGYPGPDRAPINADATFDVAAVPIIPGYTFVGGAHQGVWLINAMLQKTGTSSQLFASTALDAVGADFFGVFRHDETGEIVAVWRIQGPTLVEYVSSPGSTWSSEDPAAVRTWRLVDDDVVLLATSSSPAPALFDAIVGWHSPLDAEAGMDGPGRDDEDGRHFRTRLHGH